MDLKISAEMKDLLRQLQTLLLIISLSLILISVSLSAPSPYIRALMQVQGASLCSRRSPSWQVCSMASSCRNTRSAHHLLLGRGQSAGFQDPSLCCVPVEHEQMSLVFFSTADEIGQKSSPLERGDPKRGGAATNICSCQGKGESESRTCIRRKAKSEPADR